MTTGYVQLNPEMCILNNIGPVANYLQRIGDRGNLVKFIQGINPVRNKNSNPETLDECVKKLRAINALIPSSEKYVKECAATLFAVATGYCNGAKKQKEYAL